MSVPVRTRPRVADASVLARCWAVRGSVDVMEEWPGADRVAVYVPPAQPAAHPSDAEVRARIASARIKQGLPVSDEILTGILAAGSRPGSGEPGMFTDAEQADIYGDNERIGRAQAVLAEAEDVLGGVQVCWRNGLRGVRVLLTGDHEHWRERLSEVIELERLVIDSAKASEREVRSREPEVRTQVQQLADLGIYLTRHGTGLDGFEISYLAADHQRADRILHERFGDFATIHYDGASNHTFRPVAFGSWRADEHQLHLFYGLPRNGERPGGVQVFETDSALIVAVMILDWRGAKTLVGGFIPSHATAPLQEPLGERVVIDDIANRTRPHWTQAPSEPRTVDSGP